MNHKFSIVTYTDNELTEKIRTLQKEIFNLSGARKAMDEWGPHLTLGSGPIVEDDNIEDFKKSLEEIISDEKPFGVELKNFSSYRYTKYKGGVIFIKVILNEKLISLVEKIENLTNKYEKWYQLSLPYDPHITLAFRDLTDEGLEKCEEFFKDKTFLEEVKVDHVSIVEKGEDGTEREFARINF